MAKKINLRDLKKIDIDEISNKTYISSQKIKHLLDKDFDKLETISIKGFIGILEREYSCDLSDISEEFEAYLKEHSEVEEKNDEYLSNLESANSSNKNKLVIFIFVIIFIIALGALVFFLGNKDEIKNNEVIETKEVSNEDKNRSDIVEIETEDSVKENSGENINSDTDNKEESVDKTQVDTNENSNMESKNKEETTTNDMKKEGEPMVATEMEPKYIEPKGTMWVGVIDLKTKKKTNHTIKKDKLIIEDGEKLISTGHGKFSFFDGTKTLEFKRSSPVRIYIDKEGKAYIINYEQLKEIYGGKPW